jgi:methyltransferase (TIGR00027 family)
VLESLGLVGLAEAGSIPPDSLDSKRTRLRRLLGSEPDHVTFVAADFNRDDLGSVLARAGYLCSARTLFVCSGLLPYLSEEGASGLLSWIGSHRDPAISVAFDAAWAGAVDGSRDYFGATELRRRVADTGEPLRWGIPDGRVEETLTRFNLSVERLVDGEELHGAYLERSDGTFHDRPFGFGALIHARAAS